MRAIFPWEHERDAHVIWERGRLACVNSDRGAIFLLPCGLLIAEVDDLDTAVFLSSIIRVVYETGNLERRRDKRGASIIFADGLVLTLILVAATRV
jgi:hypothetical protein